MTGAMILLGIAFMVLTALYQASLGASFLVSSATHGLPINAPPYTPFLTAVAGGNVVLTVLISLWILILVFFLIGTTLLYASQATLAWRIAGIAPQRLGDVNEKYHSPYSSLLMWAVVGEIFLALYAFTTCSGPLRAVRRRQDSGE